MSLKFMQEIRSVFDAVAMEDKEERELASADKIFGLLDKDQELSFDHYGKSLKHVRHVKLSMQRC